MKFLKVMMVVVVLMLVARKAHAGSPYEFSGTVGFGEFVVGVGPGAAHFTISPGLSFAARNEDWFVRVQDTASILGATGGRVGLSNALSLGGGHYWENANLSGGVSISAYTVVMCGPTLCGRVEGFAPGFDLRLDLFGPYLSGALGISIAGQGIVIMGSASPVTSGLSGSVTMGPLLRFSAR